MELDETIMMTQTGKGSHRRRRFEAPGLPPGSLISDPDAAKPAIQVIAYGPTQYMRSDIKHLPEIMSFIGQWPVVWVNIDGLGDVDIIRRIGEMFELHGLALEDVLSFHQRPKIEEYGEHLFVVLRMLEVGPIVKTEQLSLFVGKNFVITFQERPGDCLDPLRRRIRDGLGRIREMGADYLVYSLVDAVIDAYFPRLEDLSDEVEALEVQVLERPTTKTVSDIHRIKRDMLAIRRAISPLRDLVSNLRRDGAGTMTDTTRVYLRDCYDHVVHILELVETHREILGGLLDIYLTSVSNRTNQIMKVLTIMATMFIPLTFLVGVYGMNFDTSVSPWNMPELEWYWGYPAFILLALLVAGVELLIFWRKGWLGSAEIAQGAESRKRVRRKKRSTNKSSDTEQPRDPTYY